MLGQVKKKKRTIALCGFAPMTRGLAPIHDPAVEIWTLNESRMMGFPRIDRLFQLHPRFMWDPNERDPEYIPWLRAQDFPIYMWNKEYDIPCSVEYPLERMIEKHGSYFTSTFAYMLAMAIDEMPDRIEIYGIDLVAEEEYRYQRAGTEYLIGWAKAVGIDVYIPDKCPLLKAPLYGRYGIAEARTLWTEEMITTRKNQLQQQAAQLAAQMNQINGALMENTNWHQVHLSQQHSNFGLENKDQAKQFAGLETVQAGVPVAQGVESDGHRMGHTGTLQTVEM